ncbi:MAG: motility protein A [Candidatus Hatepunaea meridiana]|nr:motility protein A [Candidatus Hatepunaea meridiana]
MDIATIIGILSGLALIGYNIIAGGNLDIFIHVPSMMIVFGGAVAATLVNFPFKELVGVITVVKNAFKAEDTKELDVIMQFVELSKKARREGILAIDKELAQVKDAFMRVGLEMAVDGTEPETIRNVMETDLTYLNERHKRGQQIFTSLGTYAPAFGMIGTLIGLIAMLKTLDDPSNIGQGMAVALITTFYGAFIANLVFLPVAGKLRNRSEQEIVFKQMIIEGVLAIQLGEHPKNIKTKLLNFVSPKLRKDEKDMENKIKELAA